SFYDVQVSQHRPLFDVVAGDDARLRLADPSTYAAGSLVLVVTYAIYVLYRRGPRRARLFVAALGGTAVVLVVPDLIFGGQRSTIGRYLIPFYLGLEMAVAFCLAVRAEAQDTATRRWAWRAITLGVVTAGVLTCVVIRGADTWWTKYASY